MKPTEIQTTYRLITCPVCGDEITADVHVLPTLGKVEVTVPIDMAEATSVSVPVKAEMTRFHVTHHCPGRTKAEVPS